VCARLLFVYCFEEECFMVHEVTILDSENEKDSDWFL
jgi:hypothetical protein